MFNRYMIVNTSPMFCIIIPLSTKLYFSMTFACVPACRGC